MPPAIEHAAAQGQQLGGDQRKTDAQHRGCKDADEDGFAPEIGRRAGSRKSDHDSIVACQHEIDEDDLPEGEEPGRVEEQDGTCAVAVSTSVFRVRAKPDTPQMVAYQYKLTGTCQRRWARSTNPMTSATAE